ncbi:hypothetical protein ACWC5G_30485, partial [Streptomyces sp. NPDC001274]
PRSPDTGAGPPSLPCRPPLPSVGPAQALADIPGAKAEQALAALAQDRDRAVALTAAHVLRLRDGA